MRSLEPTLVLDDATVKTFTTYFRVAASPGAVAAMDRMERDTDVRHVLSSVQVRTLVMHRGDDQVYPVEEGRYIAEHIPGARFVELEGSEHFPWGGNSGALVREIERFLASIRTEEAEFDRVLATVLFTDIVGSTGQAAAAGDLAWHELLERHHATVRAMLVRYRLRRSTRQGTGSSQPSTGRREPSAAPEPIIEAVRVAGHRGPCRPPYRRGEG